MYLCIHMLILTHMITQESELPGPQRTCSLEFTLYTNLEGCLLPRDADVRSMLQRVKQSTDHFPINLDGSELLILGKRELLFSNFLVLNYHVNSGKVCYYIGL